MQVKHKPRTTLNWPDLWLSLGFESDNAGRWYPTESTEKIQEYIYQYRSPSRAYPHSYAKAALTVKFAKWLCENEPELAVECGVGEEVKQAA